MMIICFHEILHSSGYLCCVHTAMCRHGNYINCLHLQLQKFVKADGNVEVWLMALLRMAHNSLHGVIRTAAMALTDSAGFQLLEFLNMFPAQVGVSHAGVVSKVGKVKRCSI